MRNVHQDGHAIDTTYRDVVKRKLARLVRLVLVLLWKHAICGEIDNFELLLVDFGGFIARNGRPLVMGSGTSCIVCDVWACLRGRWSRHSCERE